MGSDAVGFIHSELCVEKRTVIIVVFIKQTKILIDEFAYIA